MTAIAWLLAAAISAVWITVCVRFGRWLAEQDRNRGWVA